MSKFLNRILGVEVDMQNHLFAYFMATLEAIVQQAKRDGKYDMGILGKSNPAQEGASEASLMTWFMTTQKSRLLIWFVSTKYSAVAMEIYAVPKYRQIVADFIVQVFCFVL